MKEVNTPSDPTGSSSLESVSLFPFVSFGQAGWCTLIRSLQFFPRLGYLIPSDSLI